jgi:hypothetical protein
MTKLFDKALEAVRRLPASEQDEIARTILRLVNEDGEPEPISAADLPVVLRGLGQARRNEFAEENDVEAAFRRFDE